MFQHACNPRSGNDGILQHACAENTGKYGMLCIDALKALESIELVSWCRYKDWCSIKSSDLDPDNSVQGAGRLECLAKRS